MHQRHAGGKEVTNRQRQQGKQPQNVELRKQQDGRDDVDDDQRRLVTRNEGGHGGQLLFGKWQKNQKEDG